VLFRNNRVATLVEISVTQALKSAGLTIVANVAIATGPALLGASRIFV